MKKQGSNINKEKQGDKQLLIVDNYVKHFVFHNEIHCE